MSYTVKGRYYAEPDQFGESYVITSDNFDKDTKLEIGEKVLLVKPTEGVTIIEIRDSSLFTTAKALDVNGAAEYIKIIAIGPGGEVELFRGRLWDKENWRTKMKQQNRKYMEVIKEDL